MNSSPLSRHAEQVLALAGVVQAAMLVDKLAKTGYDDAESVQTQVHSLLATDPASTEAVFVDRYHMRSGLTALRKMLNQEGEDFAEVLRYSLSMIHLQNKLSSRNDMLAAIGSRIEQAKNQAEHFSPDHENVIANLASIYTDTISTFRFRIQVNGNPVYLRQDATVNKIRTLLLSGIRCAILWRQCGGGRIKLLFNRKRYIQACDELLRMN